MVRRTYEAKLEKLRAAEQVKDHGTTRESDGELPEAKKHKGQDGTAHNARQEGEGDMDEGTEVLSPPANATPLVEPELKEGDQPDQPAQTPGLGSQPSELPSKPEPRPGETASVAAPTRESVIAELNARVQAAKKGGEKGKTRG